MPKKTIVRTYNEKANEMSNTNVHFTIGVFLPEVVCPSPMTNDEHYERQWRTGTAVTWLGGHAHVS
jgi:hypothetical protein